MDGIGKYQQKLYCENNKITPRSKAYYSTFEIMFTFYI